MALQMFGQLRDSVCQQRDLNVRAAGILPVQLKLFEIQRFDVLCHFEAPILDQESAFARARAGGAEIAGWTRMGEYQAAPGANFSQSQSSKIEQMIDMMNPAG